MSWRASMAWVTLCALGACRPAFDPAHPAACLKDGDCGGNPTVCARGSGAASGLCCQATGPELCNGLDDDCNGVVDNGFDLNTDPANCGQCGHACSSTQQCANGQCDTLTCWIYVGADAGLTCADPSCDARACGGGCVCAGGQASEWACADGVDNDYDGKIDCADENCADAGCFDGGCTCSGLAPHETDCADRKDNDRDGLVDCADGDCVDRLCEAAPQAFRCNAAGACVCNGGAAVPETRTTAGGALCRDGLDNDCNGSTDCADLGCDLASCNPDGGDGCQCANGKRTETNCHNFYDDNFDGRIDCEDDDCLYSLCMWVGDGGALLQGACGTDHLCH